MIKINWDKLLEGIDLEYLSKDPVELDTSVCCWVFKREQIFKILNERLNEQLSAMNKTAESTNLIRYFKSDEYREWALIEMCKLFLKILKDMKKDNFEIDDTIEFFNSLIDDDVKEVEKKKGEK
jgi:hypothetical protein